MDDNTILMGDLNSVARGDVPRVAAMPLWLRLLLRFDGGIRTDVQDRLAAAGWVDAFRHLHPDDPGFTLPALEPQIRLDYALVPPLLLPAVTTARRRSTRRSSRGRRITCRSSRSSGHEPPLDWAGFIHGAWI